MGNWEKAIEKARERIDKEFKDTIEFNDLIQTSMEAALNEYIELNKNNNSKKTELSKYIVEQINETDMINLVEECWDDVILRILVEFEEKHDALVLEGER